MDYSNFDMVYMGIYSPRPGTIAAKKMLDDVPRLEKKARRQRMNEVLRRTSEANNKAEIGTKRQMMVNKVTDAFFSGYSDNMKNIIIK